MGGPATAEQAFLERCVEIYVGDLTKDLRKIDRAQRSSEGNTPAFEVFSNIARTAQGLLQEINAKRGPIRRFLERVIRKAKEYCPVGDVTVQHHAQITSLVWGAIRFLIQVGVTELETRNELHDGLEAIIWLIGRCQQLHALYHTAQRVQEAVARLFACVLSYLFRADGCIRLSTTGHFYRAAFRTTRKKLGETYLSLEKAYSDFEKEVDDANQIYQTSRMEELLSETRDLNPVRGPYAVQKWLCCDAATEDEVPPREDGTCLWLFQHPTHQKWSDLDCPECLHIYGIPGCGKSVLASYVAEKANTPVVLKYSFNNSRDYQSTCGTTFALSILFELSQIGDLTARVLSEVQVFSPTYKSARHCKLVPLLNVLDRILPSINRLTLLVDALDEYKDIHQASDPLAPWLTAVGRLTNVRVIVFSRDHARISRALNTPYAICMNSEVVNPDIQTFLKSQIRIRRLEPLESDILGKASTDCQGMFLWAKLMIEHVENGQTLRNRRRLIRQFPTGLFHAYERLIEHSNSRLTREQLSLRYSVFRLVVGARKSLTINEIDTALAITPGADVIEQDDRLIEPEDMIFEVCYPLAIVTDNQCQLIHPTAREFLLQQERASSSHSKDQLCLTVDDCNENLARKTLATLTQRQYHQWKYAAKLLRKHLLNGVVGKDLMETVDNNSVEVTNDFYRYSCLHWQDHLTELERPSETILTLLRKFIMGNEFVSWSETLFELQSAAGASAQIEVRAKLQSWYEGKLHPKLRPGVPIKDYFVVSHESLNEELGEVAEDKILSYLPLSRLGDYYNVGGRTREEWRKSYRCKKAVAEGYEALLGKRTPLTLRARTSLYTEYFWQTRMDEAEDGLQEVALIQLEVIGTDDPDYYITLHLLGLSQFYVTKFERARSSLQDSADGLRRLVGNDIKSFMADLYYGYCLEAEHGLDAALVHYNDIWLHWTKITNEDHPLSLMTEAARGSIYRKKRQFAEAQKALESSWNARQRLFSLDSNTTVDSGIQLAVLFRDSGRPNEAGQLLDEVSKSSIFSEDFERHCQISHLRALVAFDTGEYEGPKISLLNLLHEAMHDHRNNRELLWVRVTLADTMRAHDEYKLALMVFTDLVEPVAESSTILPSELQEEPETPSQLRIAEQALRCIKGGNQRGSDSLLREHKLRWTRPRDFWILQGGPITDTACMAPPRMLGIIRDDEPQAMLGGKA